MREKLKKLFKALVEVYGEKRARVLFEKLVVCVIRTNSD